MLIVFDVDGTLLSGAAADWAAYNAALMEVLGSAGSPSLLGSLQDVTAETLLQAVAAEVGRSVSPQMSALIQEKYMEGLRAAHIRDSNTFSVRPGVVSVLRALQEHGYEIAIATGDWASSIRFKLSAAGLDISKYPFASSSDVPQRAEIIKLAVKRAGRELADSIYVGDGLWDLKACSYLGIPFLAAGDRHEMLAQAGAKYICEPMMSQSFISLVLRIAGPNHTLEPMATPVLSCAGAQDAPAATVAQL